MLRMCFNDRGGCLQLIQREYGVHTVKHKLIPIGNVQAPVALSSSNKVDIMGKSFCLLSSLNIKPLSSCNTKEI